MSGLVFGGLRNFFQYFQPENAGTMEARPDRSLTSSAVEPQGLTPPGRRFRLSTLAVLLILAFAVLPMSDAVGAEPRAGRAQSPVEPALTKLHELYMATGSAVDPTAVTSSISPSGVSDAGFLGSTQVHGGLVLIEAAAVDAEAALALLEALGFAEGVVFGHSISGYLPIVAIPRLDSIEGLRSVRLARAETSAGSVTSQGDTALRANIARSTHSVDGAGVTIGVISDSYDCLGGAASGVLSGDLPSGIVVLQELTPCVGGMDEGRAMMELIHDVAPGAQLKFHTGFGGAASMAQGILDLRTAGADVIVDDIGYLTQPFFQDGVIAQAVDTVVAAGVAYFSAAGNSADQSYESVYRSGGSYAFGEFSGGTTFFGGIAHDFDPGVGVADFQRITLPTGITNITVQWDEPAFSVSGGSGSTNDLDFYLFDDPVISVLLGSASGSLGGDPVEFLSVLNTGASATVNLGIFNFSGPAPSRVKYIHFSPATIVDFPTNSSTIFGHANAAGAGSVAAAYYAATPAFGTSPPVAETFSSVGGTPILFDISGNPVNIERQKPDFTAVDGTDTTFFGFDIEPNGFPNFFGTSAAAPHAAAVAALMLEVDPTLTPAGVYSTLESTAVDMGAAGFDSVSGFGLIDAAAALSSLSTPPVVSAGADQFVNEGSTANLVPATFTDLGSGDTHTATVDWGDGAGAQVATVNQSAKTVSGNHTYTDNGIFTVTVTVTDNDGDVGSDTLSVTVSNVVPLADAGGPYSAPEGDIAVAGAGTDPGSADVLTFEWDGDYDGSTFVPDAAGVDLTAPVIAYADNGSFVMALRITDDDGGTSVIATSTVTVINANPTVVTPDQFV